MSPFKGNTPKFVDNKGQTWGPALLLVFIFVNRIDINIE